MCDVGTIYICFSLTEDHRIDFTSRGVNQCPVLLAPEDKSSSSTPQSGSGSGTEIKPIPTTTEAAFRPWSPNVISGEKMFTAKIGPTGGRKGYTAITGMPLYLNYFIKRPDLSLVNGLNRTTIVGHCLVHQRHSHSGYLRRKRRDVHVPHSRRYCHLYYRTCCMCGWECHDGLWLGNDPTNSARYHPFYITDNFEGGFGQKTEDQQRAQRVFAGVQYDANGFPLPTAGK